MPQPPASSATDSGQGSRPPAKLPFRARHRLTHAREFQAVFGARLRRSIGPLAIFLKPNTLRHPRLGLSIGRPVGSAVVRNRLKRMLREAFRLHMTAVPVRAEGSYDVVITARAHDALTLNEYADLLLRMVIAGDKEWHKRAAGKEGADV